MKGQKLYLDGQKFGAYTVLRLSEFTGNGKGKNRYWECQCKCGEIRTVKGSSLIEGVSSCRNCIKPKPHIKKDTLRKTYMNEYNIWSDMKQRCTRHNHHAAEHYVLRGITVCDRWRESFKNFFEDMGPRTTDKHSLDRIENDKGYYKENCRWATMKEQSRNRRDNARYTYNGETLCISEICEKYGISRKTMWERLYRQGWDIDKAITVKPNRGKRYEEKPRWLDLTDAEYSNLKTKAEAERIGVSAYIIKKLKLK